MARLRLTKRQLTIIILVIGVTVLFLWTPLGQAVRWVIIDSIVVTQHRDWANWIGGEQTTHNRVEELQKRSMDFSREEMNKDTIKIPEIPTGELTVETVRGLGWRGYILTVPDPRKIRLQITSASDHGENVSSMVQRTQALAGVNAGGFADPNFNGKNFFPLGFVIQNGQLLYSGAGKHIQQMYVGFDQNGYLVSGEASPQELLEQGVRDAVQFAPRIIVNGKGLIQKRSDGWGIAPRTVVGQRADGSVLFAVIDGRSASSLGASLFDVQELLLKKGAVHAANLDGGASSVLVYQGKVWNQPSNRDGERPVPTAFLVYEEVPKSESVNPWKLNGSK